MTALKKKNPQKTKADNSFTKHTRLCPWTTLGFSCCREFGGERGRRPGEPGRAQLIHPACTHGGSPWAQPPALRFWAPHHPSDGLPERVSWMWSFRKPSQVLGPTPHSHRALNRSGYCRGDSSLDSLHKPLSSLKAPLSFSHSRVHRPPKPTAFARRPARLRIWKH